jgi:hypothetical protein
MRRLSAVLIAVLLFTSATWAQAAGPSNALSWTSNSTNETSFDIQRAIVPLAAGCGAAVNFTPLASVGAGVTTYTDTAVT